MAFNEIVVSILALKTAFADNILLILGVVLVIIVFLYTNKKYLEDAKTRLMAEKYRRKAMKVVAEKYSNLKKKVASLSMDKKKLNEKFTRLSACPKSSIKENFCSCSGSKCTCNSGSTVKEAYALPGNIPVRPMQNMVAGPVGKAKQLKAEQALRGAAAGLPMPRGPMLGKEAILTAGGAETFRPNKGMY
jgi:hypothetical protein